jgi:hypothetical protein
MAMSEPSEDLQYFLKLQKQRTTTKKQEEDGLVQRENKTFRPSYV